VIIAVALPASSALPPPMLLCRCFLGGSRKDDPLDATMVYDKYLEEDGPTIHALPVIGSLSYSSSQDQPMRGVPIREGGLWLLSVENEIEMASASLYINGLSFVHRGMEHSFALSPFALVRTCKFQAMTSEGVDLSVFRCFKLSLYLQGLCFYFGVRESDEASEDVRSRWVMDISRAIQVVSQSLLPATHIQCEPLDAVSSTRTRLMAGYLLHNDNAWTVSAVYCELHPQGGDHASLIMYENETCRDVLMIIHLSEQTQFSEKAGVSCSCFSVADHDFSARSTAERKLWLRAIANVRVKLMNRAPSPSAEELQTYRLAIQECIRSGKAALQHIQAPTDPLLLRLPLRLSATAMDGSTVL